MSRKYRSSPISKLISSLAASLLTGFWLLALTLFPNPAKRQEVDKGSGQIMAELPVAFESNLGQMEEEVIYRAGRGGYRVEFLQRGVRLKWSDGRGDGAILLKFPGARQDAAVGGEDRLPGINNYFIGDNKEAWITGIPTYRKIVYEDLYPGIDLIFYGRGGSVEFDFLVAPGVDPSSIRMEFSDESGADLVKPIISGSGDLEFGRVEHAAWSDKMLRLLRPVVFQQTASGRELIEGRYEVNGETQVAIRLGEYDRHLGLVIDPLIQFSSLLGGSGQDTPHAMTIDESGNIYIVGQTSSVNFPVRNGYDNSINGTNDAFIVKISPGGSTILASTFLGGRNPGDRAFDVKVDRDGLVYVCGETLSLNFPILNGFQTTYRGNSDGFVSVFSSNLSRLVFSSYIGGSSYDTVNGMVVGADNHIYLGGGTRSTNFPVLNALQPTLKGRMDAFVARIDHLGNLVFSTYLGGPDSGIEISEEETIFDIALDSMQNIYLTGVTGSRTFPVQQAIQPVFGGVEDAFIVKMSGDGSALLYSTYLGGTRADRGRAIAVDSFGQPVITGYTLLGDFPTANALQPDYRGNLDAFVSKLTADGSEFIFSTFLGGSEEENSGSIYDQLSTGSVVLDRIGNIYVAGKTSSPDFPVSQPVQTGMRGLTDGFVCKLDPAGSSLLFSTMIGSNDTNDIGFDEKVTSLALDSSGSVNLTGTTLTGDFPTLMPFQTGYGGGISDAFLTRITTVDISGIAPVSAASYAGESLAADSIIALFSYNLAGGTKAAESIPLPSALLGTSVRVTDRLGVERLAGLFFVSPNQINLHLPPGMAEGRGRITVYNPITLPAPGQSAIVQIGRYAPALFTANADGKGAPAALLQRVRASGQVSFEQIVQLSQSGRFDPLPIDLGPEGEKVFLILFGSGWRGAGGLNRVRVRLDGAEVPVLYAGSQGSFVGLDQLNLEIPRQLVRRGEVTLTLEVGGMIANPVRIAIL